MRTILLTSFLIVSLLTAASPAPQAITDSVASPENASAPLFEPAFMAIPNLIEASGLTMGLNAKVSPGCIAPNGVRGPIAPFKIEVFGVKKAFVNINGTSRNGNYVIYCSFPVKQGIAATIELMWGNYVYLVARGSKTTRGTFFINTSDKATMRVYKDKIKIGPFP